MPPTLLLVRRRRPLGESPAVEDALRHGRDRVVAPVGEHRLADVLRGLGKERVLRSDRLVLQWLPDLETGPTALAATGLGGPFDIVVLASHLVNGPDGAVRAALLATAARHLASGGRMLVEHHPVDWAVTASESWTERPGFRLGMVDVEKDPPFVSAVSVYEVGTEIVRQPFTARVLSEAELDTALVAAGLAVRGRLSPTWLEAEPVGRRSR